MGWLSDFLGGKKIRIPKVKPAEEFIEPIGAKEAYLKEQSRKSGFVDTILTGRKTPKLAFPSLL
jgi:hypothetical protein